MPISSLDENTKRLLTTTQIITSVYSAVKELVENAFDANARNIEINLVDNGTSFIEVKDDGNGIAEEDCTYMALPFCTSKISNFEDLAMIQTYGFRGEALNALCRIADIKIITKTDTDDVGRLYIMDENGSIKKMEYYARPNGTTIQVIQIFHRFPVRRKIITNSRKANQDIKLLDVLLKGFGICNPSVRISYKVNNKVLFTKPSFNCIEDAAANILGNKIMSKMKWITHVEAETKIQMMVPDKDIQDIHEVLQSNVQYIFINNRPVNQKDIVKAIDFIMLEYFGERIPVRKKPIYLLYILMNPIDVDVNLEPNKDTVLFRDQKIITIITKHIENYYEIQCRNENNHSQDITREKVEEQTNKKLKLQSRCDETYEEKTENTKEIRCNPSEKVDLNKSVTHNLLNLQIDKLSQKDKILTEETLSQLPVVDLGEDFDITSILNEQSNVNHDSSANFEIDNNRSIEQQNKKKSHSVEAWSKGQINGLTGGTNVEIYNESISDSLLSTSASNVANSEDKSLMDNTFRKFAKDARLEILEENPKLSAAQIAYKITHMWKHISSQEHGYYQDLVQEEKLERQAKEKAEKKKQLDENVKKNKNRLLRMLENMKKGYDKIPENLAIRTTVPWDVNIEKVKQNFYDRTDTNYACQVIGSINANLWIVRNSAQLWILNNSRLFKELNATEQHIDKVKSEDIEKLFKKWLLEKNDMSIIFPIHTL